MRIWEAIERVAEPLLRLFTRDKATEGVPMRLDWLQPSGDPACLGTLGRFRVIKVLGSGGMGTVLLAQDPTRNRQVAIKVLNPEYAEEPRIRRRFLREARIAMSIHHPHVVSTHGVDRDPDHPFIVSEYLAGGSLQQLIDCKGTLPVPDICDIASQMARGLDAIHRKRLVHADIKPQNILLDESQRVAKIGDFGLARLKDARGVVQQRTVFATPQYASPEQLRGFKIDHRSDLFSMGSVLYAMCTAKPPFPGESSVAVARRVCSAQPRSIRKVNPDVPIWLTRIVEKLMAKDVRHRYSSAAELERELSERRWN